MVAWTEVMPLRVTALGEGTSVNGSRGAAPARLRHPQVDCDADTNVVCEGVHGVTWDSTGKQPRTTRGRPAGR